MRLALYQPDIAQNFGTTLRTCACLGVGVDVIEPCGFPLNDKKIRRAGMDYIKHVDYTKHISWEHFIESTSLENKRLILLSSKASKLYTEFRFKSDDILIVGRESAGVPESVNKICHHKITIPMRQGMRSLNVAIAAAMTLGEALRQTHW